MKLMTKALEKRFAEVGRQDGKGPPLIIAKFFAPVGAATWWMSEYSPNDRIFFGFADLGDPVNAEWGYVSLDEMESVTMPAPFQSLGIERDLHWTEKPADQVEQIKKVW